MELIDERIACDPKSRISYGQVVLGMLLNGLGFTSRPMYLSPQFFANKPLDLLIGPEIEASDLGDYQLGKTLDAIHQYGCSKLFEELGSAIFLQEGLSTRVGHYDTTSVSVHGKKYESEEGAIELSFGYSKDKRPDLRQFMIGLMVEPSYGIPWMFKALDGKTSNKAHFQEVINSVEQEAKASEAPMLLVADSALFSEEGLSQIDRVNYLTRVPHTLSQAKDLLSRYQKEDFSVLENGYGWKEHRVKIFGREMRWLVVWSDQAFNRELNTLERTILKQENTLNDALSKLRRKDFGCKEDATKAVETLVKKYRYLQLDSLDYTSKNKSTGRGRPKAGSGRKGLSLPQKSIMPRRRTLPQKTTTNRSSLHDHVPGIDGLWPGRTKTQTNSQSVGRNHTRSERKTNPKTNPQMDISMF